MTDLEVFSRYAPAQVDAFGTVLATFEGGYGGGTLLVWSPRAWATEVLRRLPRTFRGRIVLGLDASPSDRAPFAHALERVAPEAVLLVEEGSGLFHAGGGWKEIATENGSRKVALEHPEAALELERVAPTGLRYREPRAYPAWNSPALDGSRSGARAPQGAAARERGLKVYAAGLLNLDEAWTSLFRLD